MAAPDNAHWAMLSAPAVHGAPAMLQYTDRMMDNEDRYPMRTMFAWLFVGLGLSLPVAAGNLNFLKDGPVGKFTDRDWEMMQETTRTALDNAPDGETVSWSNSDSGASGTIRPLETYDMDGMRCRRTELSNSAGGLSGNSQFDYCQQTDGVWKIATPKQTPAAN
ncbi:MAG: hypothetical protein H6956_06125 [Chromatiaceae bacterium]|nr:hypothetical protein [Gammaproteobacteria bacterium]MCP5317491.1 hypothetical protein [Chromatiaceae bacterium]MCP5436162.1 hypothetical protein [Chromatiaceae bacterium]MCW5587049.1 hypothetical protein [Chromatiales bacterium]HOP15939.1 RT0821/Lpp0805 family surface protein [Gammaproteobacteria bacterium]